MFVVPGHTDDMRLSRLSWGIVAAAVAFVTLFAAQAIEMRLVGRQTRAPVWIAGAAGVGVLLLVDRLGLMASPYEDSPLGLNRRDNSDGERDARERRRGSSGS